MSFKVEYFDEARSCAAAGLWYEIHAENYMVAGGPRLAMLDDMRAGHPISVHGVGLSLAADAEPERTHLEKLRELLNRVQPFVVSEHLAWSGWRGNYLPDLLPFPRTVAALRRIVRNIEITQDFLQRSILIENPSLYVQRTGCGLLVDVNNAYVTANNIGSDAVTYLKALPAGAIGEIHLAGHTPDQRAQSCLLIDTHAEPVAEAVWGLYQQLINRIGRCPTLIERDDNLPAFTELMTERARAATILHAASHTERRHVHAH